MLRMVLTENYFKRGTTKTGANNQKVSNNILGTHSEERVLRELDTHSESKKSEKKADRLSSRKKKH